ncbi:S8 family peptidase [Streptomyces fructofermentans]|uniref:Serine protease n=1 Tax=Streptomyces fructofermentans TaxID=152141 RepID=A0A918KQL0_9ACTN|nr:S8 family peptidase [Streptomyces fructofermentans]GGX72113.1 hypothetical protein GCM10010515_44390 [Streptomyces fructofermentans]
MGAGREQRSHWAEGFLAMVAAAVLSAVAPPAHAASEAGSGGTGTAVGSYIVTLDGRTSAPSREGRAVAAAHGVRISQTYGTALNGYAVRADPRQAARLAADPRVASVSPDTAVAVAGRQPDPPWNLDRLDSPDRPTWPPDRGYSWPESAGRGVTAYVIDTGVRVTHRDFGGRARDGWDFVDDDAVAQDGQGHGTHVAGILAGRTYGVAKRAEVVAVRVFDDDGAGTLSRVLAGIDWVTRHAQRPAVANLSLGGPADPRLDAAVRNSIASGVTYTVAAGNADRPARLYSPARVEEAITVGAVDRTDRRADFSNRGARIDLFAPGVNITSASHTGDTDSATLSGTSMASPHAAGAAALHLADHPSASPAEVGESLAERAADGRISDPGPGSPNRLLQVRGP